MTVTTHPYVPVLDLQRVIDFRRACATPENLNDYPTVVDLYEILDPSVVSKAERTICLWEDENGKLAAFEIVALKYNNLYFLIDPRRQEQALEEQIIDWGRQQIRAAGKSTAMDTPCRDTDFERVALLERQGFTLLEDQTLHMQRSLAEPVPVPEFPEGFTLRHVLGEQEVDAVVELHRAAFGTQNMTRELRLGIMRNPEYLPELDLLLVATDRTPVAFCYCIISQEANKQSGRKEGEIAIIGTRPGYQRHGLGQAMLLAGLQRLKQHNIETATLATSSDNTRAQSLFLTAGFHIAYRSLWYSTKA